MSATSLPSALYVNNALSFTAITKLITNLSGLLLDFVNFYNLDSVGANLVLRTSVDGGATTQPFYRVNLSTSGASANQPFGGLYIPAGADIYGGLTTAVTTTAPLLSIYGRVLP